MQADKAKAFGFLRTSPHMGFECYFVAEHGGLQMELEAKTENAVYISMLKDSLMKKTEILDELTEITLRQEKLLCTEKFDIDGFEDTINEKAPLIQKINELDSGFQRIYYRVREEMGLHKALYKNEILEIKELIRNATEKIIKLQTMEQQNKIKMQSLFTSKRNSIKQVKVGSRTASAYYKNMAGMNGNSSIFMDRKN